MLLLLVVICVANHFDLQTGSMEIQIKMSCAFSIKNLHLTVSVQL